MDKESRQGLGWFLLAIVLILLIIAAEPTGTAEKTAYLGMSISVALGIKCLIVRDD